MYTSDTFILKAINLQVNDWLYGRIKGYTDDRGIPVVAGIRLILSEFFRNKTNGMNKYEDLPPGIIDLGEGKGFVIDMKMLTDESGVVHVPPPKLTKDETWEWIRRYHNGKTKEA